MKRLLGLMLVMVGCGDTSSLRPVCCVKTKNYGDC